jgi:FtsH-binding integral membrane protein
MPDSGRFTRVGSSSDVTPPVTDAATPRGLRVTAVVLRTLFICAVILITLAVSMPQNETIWTVYDTPLDVVRLLLGLVVCGWLAVQLFKGPRDPHGYRTWLYLGLAAVPFALICLAYLWRG